MSVSCGEAVRIYRRLVNANRDDFGKNFFKYTTELRLACPL
jgi:hypothetical protein